MAQTSEKTNVSEPGQGLSPFLGLRRDIDRLFDDFTGGFRGSSLGRRVFDLAPLRRLEGFAGDLYPDVDVSESDKALTVTAELPGMKEKDIEVTLDDDGVLSIHGEKKEEREEKGENRYVSERRYGSFSRSFRMPDTVAGGKIKADFDKGVLTVTLPKNAKAKKARIIEIGKN